MAARFQYKAPFGLDIRVKPAKRPQTRRCDWPGCMNEAVAKAPKSRDSLREYHHFCLEHAREYNRGWNFFDGMDDEEFLRFQDRERTGDRPTWNFGRAGRSAKTARASAGANGFHDNVEDPFGFFRGDAAKARGQGLRPDQARKVGRMQRMALDVFDLEDDATPDAVKKRYGELLKRFHPDANGGDRSHERRLQKVIEAYRTLKKAGYC